MVLGSYGGIITIVDRTTPAFRKSLEELYFEEYVADLDLVRKGYPLNNGSQARFDRIKDPVEEQAYSIEFDKWAKEAGYELKPQKLAAPAKRIGIEVTIGNSKLVARGKVCNYPPDDELTIREQRNGWKAVGLNHKGILYFNPEKSAKKGYIKQDGTWYKLKLRKLLPLVKEAMKQK